jgi:hypothetical protein
MTLKATGKLWHVVGTSPDGNPVRMTVRAADYLEAQQKARSAKVLIRDLVLVEPVLTHAPRSPIYSG